MGRKGRSSGATAGLEGLRPCRYRERLRARRPEGPEDSEHLVTDGLGDGRPTGEGAQSPPAGLRHSRGRPGRSLAGEQDYLCRQNRQQQVRLRHVAQLESSLCQQALTLYPHVKDSMPPELFEEVLSALDPEIPPGGESWRKEHRGASSRSEARGTENLDDDSVAAGAQQVHFWSISSFSCLANVTRQVGAHGLTQLSITAACGPSPVSSACLSSSSRSSSLPRNPYTWSDVQGDQGPPPQPLQPTSLDEDIQRVTEQLCTWMASLGGESSQLNEAALLDMFVCAYEHKPSTALPAEAAEPAGAGAERSGRSAGRLERCVKQVVARGPEGLKRPAKSRVRYGAWYLRPETWGRSSSEGSPKEPLTLCEDRRPERLSQREGVASWP
uniref:Uncharacterized protein n=1 Tax=Scleropages formosus TaxID=113540 RepID=A0A8C9VR02_SCLFO